MVALVTCGRMLFGCETVLGLSLIKPPWTGGGVEIPLHWGMQFDRYNNEITIGRCQKTEDKEDIPRRLSMTFPPMAKTFPRHRASVISLLYLTFVRYNNEITLARAKMRHAINVAANKPKTS